MTALAPEQWRRLKEVVASALELPPDHCAGFLDDCGLDGESRRRVEAMLGAYRRQPSFLERAADLPVELCADSPRAGDLIGGYRVIRRLGEGGMGQVLEAEQTRPIRRRVALKLLRPGGHHRGVLERFEAERQTLALMSHPHIARVFDAGESGGRPYLVMELVDGLPITDYCDRHGLSIEARLRLFLDVCRGVQHAHQRGVIHRDLKPSNVLVSEQDGEPAPKIIDFGIAKALCDALGSPQTELGQWLGTPDYMSPEQAAGAAGTVDTRSDVYSLGMLLYQLLTGTLPFDTTALRRHGLDVLLRTLQDEAPERPSHACRGLGKAGPATRAELEARAAARGLEPGGLGRRLEGELDLVVLKCLEKDKERRYASPLELATDLGRHLAHEPLQAAQADTFYQLRKLVRRHRVVVALCSVVALSLLLGIAGTSLGLVRARGAERQARWQAEQAREEAARANREAETASRVTAFMLEVFKASDPSRAANRPGLTLREVLDRGAEKVRQELGAEPRVGARLMAVIGSSYNSLGLYAEARELLQQAADLQEEIPEDRLELASTLHNLAGVQSQLAAYEEGLGTLERCLEIRRSMLGDRHPQVSWALHDKGRILASQGKIEQAIEIFEQALELKREAYGDEHVQTAKTLNSLGLRLIDSDRIERGLPLLEQSLAILEQELGADHPKLAPPLNNIAKASRALGDLAKAELYQSRTLEIDEKAFGGDHPFVAMSLMNLAFLAYESRRDCKLTLIRARRAMEIFEQHLPAGHPSVVAAARDLRSFEGRCAPRELQSG